jgi:hypothetical protein
LAKILRTQTCKLEAGREFRSEAFFYPFREEPQFYP